AVELNNLLFSAALSSMAVAGTTDASRDLTLVDVIEGEEVLFEAVTAPSFNRDGMRSGLVTVMRDVTDLRRADQEFRANMERLHQPEARTEIDYDTRSGKIYDARGQVSFTITVLRDLSALRRLEQMKLERRRLEIEKFAATGRMAGTIAHEINNPMEAIKNSIFLLSGQVKPKAEPVYDILKAETERVARIVRQMLGLYRHSEQITTVDVNSVIEDTLALFM